MKNTDNKNINSPKNKITRKEAIKKAGKFAALAAATILILSPKESQAQSPSSSPRAPRNW